MAMVRTFACVVLATTAITTRAEVDVIDVAPVWAGHPVGFYLMTHAPNQYIAYYDAERQMTVAQRSLASSEWTFTKLPEHVGWDSHNSIVMTIDDDDHLHLAGNMHIDPLRYFRTTRPLDSTSFECVPSMIGTLEERATYPRFLRGPDDQLLFTYRDGSSGSGNQIWNAYDVDTQTWRRLLDKPLIDGQGERNAYFNGPIRGPDGFWHLCWVWRDTSDCATNHHPSYARSRDMINWEKSDGTPLPLPITFATGEVIDPVPPGGGVINGNVKLGFDDMNRAVVTYHKYDEAGFTQIYLARRETDGWKHYPVTDWEYRWEFQGGGSIEFEIRVQPLHIENGDLILRWSHKKFGSQRWRLDPDSLIPKDRLPNPPSPIPSEVRKLKLDFPGMRVNTRGDMGESKESGVQYFIRWETLGPNRDKPREKPWPPPSMLQLIRIEK